METLTRTLFRSSLPVFLVLCLTASAAPAAENSLGGHFGAVVPIVTNAGGETTTLSDDFKIGFPTGITVKKNARWAFDLEVVPVIDNDPLNISLTIHPGVIRSLSRNWALGLRMAFDVKDPSWGFTPLVNKGFPNGDHAFFVEAVFPLRFQEDSLGESQTSIGFAVHLGIGF